MYLGYFEKIVAAAVAQLGGPQDWALPYWNYSSATASGTLPRAFFQAQTPDQVANPLLEPDRDSGNDGQPFLPTSDVDVTNALREPRFQADLQGGSSGFGGPRTQFSHTHGPHGALEQIPHDLVHDDVGGLMGDPETAGYDPIFWLHHANIDRLWEVWRNITPPHQNPTDSSWLRFSFQFKDGSGNVKTLAPQDVLDTKSAPFYYQYDDISQAAPATLAIVSPETARLMAEEPTPEMVGASSEATPLSGESQTLPVRLFPVSGPARAALNAGGHFQKAYLHVENIRGKGRPPNYDVYLNIPEGEAASERFFVGTIPMFGLEQASIATERHPGNGLHFTFNITDTINFLKAESHWNPALLRVTFVPRKRPIAGWQLEVGRVSLYYT